MLDPLHILTLTTILAVLGLWLMLPRGAARGRALGVILSSIALGLAASQMPGLGDCMLDVVFFILAAVAVVSAAAAITFRNPLYSAIWFGLSLLGVAGLFLLLAAQFLALATVVVYVGAILVTFLFVLMLAQPEGKAPYDRVSWESLISAATGVLIIAILSASLPSPFGRGAGGEGGEKVAIGQWSVASEKNYKSEIINHKSHVARLGAELFGKHLPEVEIVGLLLLTSLVGATAIVGHKRTD